MSEFSDRPFVAGSVVGLRAFRIDTLGRLTGVTHKDVWVPGENVAQCHATDLGEVVRQMNVQIQHMTAVLSAANSDPRGFGRRGRKNNPIPKTPTPAEKAKAVTHALAGVSCQCGFYAYFDGGNDYLTDNFAASGMIVNGGFTYTTGSPDTAARVGAVIEGWGTCTVGTRGFRAEKAKVLALIKPKGTDARREVAFLRAQRNYPDVAVFATERDAIAEFPLSDPIAASPDDEDFWTRSAS
jgi:hypothetical protein